MSAENSLGGVMPPKMQNLAVDLKTDFLCSSTNKYSFLPFEILREQGVVVCSAIIYNLLKFGFLYPFRTSYLAVKICIPFFLTAFSVNLIFPFYFIQGDTLFHFCKYETMDRERLVVVGTFSTTIFRVVFSVYSSLSRMPGTILFVYAATMS